LGRRIGVLGLGLIGGSIGLGLREADSTTRVVGYDPDRLAVLGALERGAIDEAVDSPVEAATGAAVVMLAMPVEDIAATCSALASGLDPGSIVSDAGSTKKGVVEAGESAIGPRFVGGHPMAGSERHGIDAADAALFDGAWWILTPTSRTSPDAYSDVSAIVQSLGAKPVAVDPEVHDSLVARLSHLPQLTASALVEVASTASDRDALLGLAARGFRDVTRIAASNPDLWVGIVRSNRPAVLEALKGLAGRLQEVSDMIERGEWDKLRDLLDRTREARLGLFAKPDFGGEPVGLTLMVPDRPGVLAEVTTAAGQLGANIEDLRIVHSTEGGRGRLELVLAGRESAELLVGALVRLGYRVDRVAD
jgi:prephenate dehydrogenase